MKIENVLDLERVKKVIEVLKQENDTKKNFSSHDFIRKYSKLYEKEYGGKLTICNFSHKTLHSLMARYLACRSEDLNINKEEGKRSGKGDPTIFGYETKVQGWEHV